MPAERRGYRGCGFDRPARNRGIALAAGLEVDADAADPARVHLFQVGPGKTVVNDGNAPRAGAERPEGLQRAGVVGAVGTGLHHHRALEPKRALEPEKLFYRRFRGCVLPVFRQIESGVRSKDMDMAIAGALQNFKSFTCFARLPHSATRNARSVPVDT